MGGKKAILDAMWSTKPMAAPLLPLLPAEVTVTRGTWPLACQLAAPRSRRRQVQHARVPALTQRQLALPAAQAYPCLLVCSCTQSTNSSSTDARASVHTSGIMEFSAKILHSATLMEGRQASLLAAQKPLGRVQSRVCTCNQLRLGPLCGGFNCAIKSAGQYYKHSLCAAALVQYVTTRR